MRHLAVIVFTKDPHQVPFPDIAGRILVADSVRFAGCQPVLWILTGKIKQGEVVFHKQAVYRRCRRMGFTFRSDLCGGFFEPDKLADSFRYLF